MVVLHSLQKWPQEERREESRGQSSTWDDFHPENPALECGKGCVVFQTRWLVVVAVVTIILLLAWLTFEGGQDLGPPSLPAIENSKVVAREKPLPTIPEVRLSSGVRVLSMGNPVPGAAVTFSGEQGSGVIETDEDGRAFLIAGSYILSVAAKNHELFDQTVEISGALEPIALVPFGTVRYTISDGGSAPLAGVRLTVIPKLLYGPRWNDFWPQQWAGLRKIYSESGRDSQAKLEGISREHDLDERQLEVVSKILEEMDAIGIEALAGNRWVDPKFDTLFRSIEWEKESDSLGQVELRVPAGFYRTGLLGDRLCVMEPVHEGKEAVPIDGGLRVYSEDRPVKKLSGLYPVSAGEVTQFHLVVASSRTVLRGRLVVPAEFPDPQHQEFVDVQARLRQVKLEDSDQDGQIDFSRSELQADEYGEQDGSFEFTGILGGPQEWRVCGVVGRQGENHYYAAAGVIDIVPGEVNDLGDVRATVGNDLWGQAYLSIDGEFVHPEEVFGPEFPSYARMRFDNLMNAWGLGKVGSHATMSVPLTGESFVIHGFEADGISLRVQPEVHWPPLLPGFELRKPDRMKDLSAPSGPHDFVFRVLQTTDCRLEFRFPAMKPMQIKVFLRHQSGSVQEVRLNKPHQEKVHSIEFDGALRPGAYELLAHTNQARNGDENYFVLDSFEVARPSVGRISPEDFQHFEFDLEPGVMVQIQAVDGEGEPIRNDWVSLTIDGWGGADGDDWTYSAPNDGEGWATFVGIPPATRLWTHLDRKVVFKSSGSNETVTRKTIVDTW